MNSHTENQASDYTIPVTEDTSLRLYSDTRPHNHHIANLQKGLILVHKGTEHVGEGAGFGVPVARYLSKTYFSGTSKIHVSKRGDCPTVTKQFILDMISQKQLGAVKIEKKPVHKLTRYVDELYRKHRRLRLLTLAKLSRSLSYQTSFVKAKPVGSVDVTYRIKAPILQVDVRLDMLVKDKLEAVFLLNEQSSRFLREYVDSSGVVLLDRQIGAWEKVEADWACMLNDRSRIGFRLWKTKDADLCRGREYLKDTFDWAGLDYEIRPETTRFAYEIELIGSQNSS